MREFALRCRKIVHSTAAVPSVHSMFPMLADPPVSRPVPKCPSWPVGVRVRRVAGARALDSVASVTGDDVRAAAELCRRVLEPALGVTWSVAVPGLEFTVASVVAHAAEAPLWYSVDLWSGRENAAFEVKVLPDAANASLLTSLVAASAALAAGVDTAPPGTRGFHPFGSPDPEGFAAMGCDELLVHGDDAAAGSACPSRRTGGWPPPSSPDSFPGTPWVPTTIRGNCCCGPTDVSRSRGEPARAGGAGTALRSPNGTARAAERRREPASGVPAGYGRSGAATGWTTAVSITTMSAPCRHAMSPTTAPSRERGSFQANATKSGKAAMV